MIIGYRLAPLATLHVGDCIEVMAAMPEASVDAVVCDPPYGLEFMGKEWDSFKTDKRGLARTGNTARAGVRGEWVSARPQAYDAGVPFAVWCEAWASEAYRVLKPGGHLLAFGGTRTFHRLTVGIEDAGFEIRDCLSWLYGSGFPKSLDVSKAIDKAAGVWRGRSGAVISENGSMSAANYERTPKGEPATDAAREWQGWGTALKPAWEPCVVARKPLVGTVAANVQAHGTGALNIDGCRIGTTVETWPASRNYAPGKFEPGGRGETVATGDAPPGRWPANVALDEDAAAMLDAQSGEQRDGVAVQRNGGGQSIWGATNTNGARADAGYGGKGGASRFYYVAKASKKDRTAGGTVENTHPTVKPTALMQWLVRLVTPPGGVVLDPFAGSGSTLVAAVREGVRCIGIEREQEYAEIIAGRVAAEAEVPTLFAA